MNPGKLRGEADRGAKAAALLRNDLLIEAFDTLEAQYTTAWAESPARDVDGREHLFVLLKSLRAVKQHLTTVVETGKLAERQLHQSNK